MTTKEILDRVVDIIRDLTMLHSELSQELPNLRIEVDNTRMYSDVKKTPKRLFLFSNLRRTTKTTRTATSRFQIKILKAF